MRLLCIDDCEGYLTDEDGNSSFPWFKCGGEYDMENRVDGPAVGRRPLIFSADVDGIGRVDHLPIRCFVNQTTS